MNECVCDKVEKMGEKWVLKNSAMTVVFTGDKYRFTDQVNVD